MINWLSSKDYPPPANTWIWAAYQDNKADKMMALTCKKGCCMHVFMDCIELPKYWSKASKDEILAFKERL